MRLADDIDLLTRICRTVGGLSVHDRRLLAWILAADVTFEEDVENENKSSENTERRRDAGENVR